MWFFFEGWDWKAITATFAALMGAVAAPIFAWWGGRAKAEAEARKIISETDALMRQSIEDGNTKIQARLNSSFQLFLDRVNEREQINARRIDELSEKATRWEMRAISLEKHVVSLERHIIKLEKLIIANGGEPPNVPTVPNDEPTSKTA